MKITVDCPQCGGPITFDEELEVLRCPYCGCSNQLSGKSGLLRFMLPPRWNESQCLEGVANLFKTKESLGIRKPRLRLVYAPYWRSKGMVFHWMLGKRHTVSKEMQTRSWEDVKELKTKAFDFSFPAHQKAQLGLQSLGVRTAALPLQLYHRARVSANETVLPIEVSLQEAIKHCSAFLTFGFTDRSLKVELEDTQFVGEIYSVVYFPFWLLEITVRGKNALLIVDGTANRVRRTIWEQDLSSFIKEEKSDVAGETFGSLNLIPCRCPICGWDLPFSPQSKTHVCPTCTRAWTEKQGSYKEIDYRLVSTLPDLQHDVYYMPFWDLIARIHTSEGVLSNRADLSRLIPSLQAGQGTMNALDPIRFLIPAFKINSMPAFSRLATQFSLHPPEQANRPKEYLEKEKFAGVYLAGKEAAEMAHVVLIEMLPKYHRRARKSLQNVRIETRPPLLVYYPFYRKGLYLREVNSNLGIQHGAVPLSSTE